MDGLQEAIQIVSTAEKQGLRLRLLGGLGFKIACPSTAQENHAREYKDIDIIGPEGSSGKVSKLLESLGYRPREIFNKLNMGSRLIFYNKTTGRKVDVFLGEFVMCHKFDFHDHMGPGPALPITDLVMTKLQVRETTDKEYRDLSAAFTDFDVTEDENGINGNRIAGVCSKDWGVYRTFIENLMTLLSSTDGVRGDRINRLISMIEHNPKSMAWRLRATIGERAKWYEEPEAIPE